jgi:gamma-glutamyltranspeptidase / glutathione hydrolase
LQTGEAFRMDKQPMISSYFLNLWRHCRISSRAIPFAFALACTTGDAPPRLYELTPALKSFAAERVATGKNGAVSTAHPLASQAAMKVLKAGGNAADAAVAASFVISVVRPQSTGIGGGGFLVFHDSAKNLNVAYDFRERAPAKATRNMYLDKDGKPKTFRYRGKTLPNASVNGHLSVATPGLVKGLLEFHRIHGSQPLKTLLNDAIRIADEGFAVYPSLAEAIGERRNVLEAFEDSRRIFLPNGKALKVGDRLVQKDLAWTLRQIAEKGVAGFYQGQVSDRIIKEINAGNGILSRSDFNNYQVQQKPPVRGTFRGNQIVSMPPPSSGGVHLIQMLNMLEREHFTKANWGKAETVHIIAEAMRRAFADRAQLLGDPAFVKVPTRGLLDKGYAQELRKSINPSKATDSTRLGPSKAGAFESPSTTHLSIIDVKGNAVSSTQTVNYTFGSGVVARGTGIILNNEMDDFSIAPGIPNAYGLVGNEANAIAPNKTMLSSMTPTIVLDDRNQVKMIVGSPGGPRIINATFLTVLHVLAFEMSLPEAVHALRFHHQYLPDVLRLEKGRLAASEIAKLENMGHKIQDIQAVGDVQAIMKHQGGWIAVSDTRSEGVPLAY